MGVLPRRLIKQNLNEVEVFLQDDNNEFIVVQDIPDTFGQGRASFKVFGSDLLKQGVKLKAEILDANGTPVFITPVRYRYNTSLPTLPFTYFSVEVYSPPVNVGGKAELIILGELDNEKINVPREFVGRYNVRYRKTINLDVSKTTNTSPILFYKKPSVTTNEILKKRLIPIGSNLITTATISGSGISGFSLNAGDRYFPDPTSTAGGAPAGTDTTNTQEETSTIKNAPGGDFTELSNLKAFKTGEVKRPSILAKVSSTNLFASEEPPQMKIFSTGSLFTSDMAGGEIRIPSSSIIVFNPKQYVGGSGDVGIGTGLNSFPSQLDLAAGPELEGAKIFISDYTGSIERVVNDKEIHVKEPFYLQHGDGAEALYYLADFGNHPHAPIETPGSPRADFTMSFQELSTSETSSFAFDSFIDLTLNNLRTFSGDVYRLRVSGGSKTQVSDFPVLLDTVLESPQLMIDADSPSGVLRTGYIQSQAHITKYWESNSNLETTFDSSEIVDAVNLSGSLSQKDDVGRFSLKVANNFEVVKDVVYTLSMRIVGKKGRKVQQDNSVKNTASIKFHISGSQIPPDINPKYSDPTSFGKTIKDEFGNVVGLELTEESPDKVDYGKVSHTFRVPFKKSQITNSDTTLQFRVESGEWFISDISLRPALDTGFSPDNVQVRVPIPTNTQRPDKFQFILQYYDVNNNEAEEVTLVDDVDVEGQALLIQGDDNLVKGTVTVGNVQGQGVEIVGGNSAFIRAVGYTGFKDARAGTGGGFFIWSGSVAPGGETQDTYNGAGLEIHDGNTGDNESFFKFRTDDADNDNSSSFDIKTSRFFLGGTGQFISGSLGNIEISSSNLHLTPEGNITASNFQMNSGVIRDTVQILGAVSANSILTPASIGGSPATVANASSSIDSQGFAKFVSASIGGWDITSEAISDLNPSGKGIEIKSDPSSPTITIKEDSNNKIELFHNTSNNFGVKGVSGSVNVFQLGSTNKIAGWTFSNQSFTGGNMIIQQDGTIQTADFATRVKGFRISADGNGTAEFENVRIRGTLKTTTFEKETVNAVGGRLYVANSTVMSSSISSSQTAIAVDNASGFEVDEIIFAKKITGTGFSKEFMQITSISRADPSNDTDFTGILHVTRSFGQSDFIDAPTDSGLDLDGAINAIQTTLTVDQADARTLDKDLIQIDDELMMVSGSPDSTTLEVHRGVDGTAKVSHSNNAQINVLDKDSAFLFGLVSPAEDYTEGQVLVSTGRFLGGTGNNTTGSGLIEINANPTTGATPFIEMLERTGSGIYDMKRKLVIGDLSGFVGSAIGKEVSLPNNPGFGLASENVFLSGLIQATSGSIGGIIMESNKLFTNPGVHGGSTTGFFLNSDGDFSLKDKFVFTNSSGNLTVNANSFDLNTTSLRVSSSRGGTIALGSTAPGDLSSDGIFLTGSGDFNLQNGSSFIRGTSAGLEMNYPSFSVDTSGVITAQAANIAGTITAESGEIGSGSFRWLIDGDKIINSAESNFTVEMNAGEGTEGFFLTSGSKQAQIVPEFTPSAQVLGGGGSNTFNFTGGTEGSTYGQEITVNHDSSNTTAVRFGYNNGETTFTVGSSDPNNGNTLSSGTKYKSTAVLGLKSLVTLGNGGEVAGNVTVTGNIQLINNDDSDAVIETHTIDTTLPHDFVTIRNKTITVSTIHTPSSNHKYYWKLNALTVTNNNITEEYVAGSKTNTNSLNNTFDVFFKQSIHTPQNNLTEIAPGGFQAVFLSDGTLETSPNAYFKVDGSVSNQVDILGEATITGSLVVKTRGSSPKTTIAGGTLTSTQTITGNKLVSSTHVETAADEGIEFGTTAKISHASSLLKFFAGNQSTLDMTLSDAGALSTRGDITAFATSITSDKRFKTNIIPITNSLDKIKKLKGVEFDWYKEYDGEGHDIGFIAQEVREVGGLEPLVKESENLRLGDKSLNVSYSKLIPVLVEAIKEQQKQIDELKKKLEEL